MINLKKLRQKITLSHLAKDANIPLSTVYSWKDKIPAWRIPAIEEYCRINNIDISDCYEGDVQ